MVIVVVPATVLTHTAHLIQFDLDKQQIAVNQAILLNTKDLNLSLLLQQQC